MIVHELEQRSDAWRTVRAGIPTASQFGNLLTPTGKLSTSIDAYAVDLANEVYLDEAEPDGWQGNGWTDRGEELEIDAIAYYQMMNDAPVEQVGFVTDDKKQVGCSPDALVGPDGMLEIKALKAINHTIALHEYEKTGECPKKYRAQTQGQMMICERKWCDLLFYHPKLPAVIIRQFPDTETQSALKKQIISVRQKRDEVLKALRSI